MEKPKHALTLSQSFLARGGVLYSSPERVWQLFNAARAEWEMSLPSLEKEHPPAVLFSYMKTYSDLQRFLGLYLLLTRSPEAAQEDYSAFMELFEAATLATLHAATFPQEKDSAVKAALNFYDFLSTKISLRGETKTLAAPEAIVESVLSAWGKQDKVLEGRELFEAGTLTLPHIAQEALRLHEKHALSFLSPPTTSDEAQAYYAFMRRELRPLNRAAGIFSEGEDGELKQGIALLYRKESPQVYALLKTLAKYTLPRPQDTAGDLEARAFMAEAQVKLRPLLPSHGDLYLQIAAFFKSCKDSEEAQLWLPGGPNFDERLEGFATSSLDELSFYRHLLETTFYISPEARELLETQSDLLTAIQVKLLIDASGKEELQLQEAMPHG